MKNNKHVISFIENVKGLYKTEVIDLAPAICYNPLIKINLEIENIFKENYNNIEICKIIDFTESYKIMATSEKKGRMKKTEREEIVEYINIINSNLNILDYIHEYLNN